MMPSYIKYKLEVEEYFVNESFKTWEFNGGSYQIRELP